ncbi:MAG: response regulator, partial [Magnetospirillum sp.]|nr:response regulator [Magnetospirillum sp.]
MRNETDRIRADVLRFTQDMRDATRRLNDTMAQLALREEELARVNERLVDVDQAKTTFVSNIAHEFRNPLQLMLGPLEDGLARAASGVGVQREMLELAHRNALRLLKLVASLRDFSRVDSRQAEATYRPIDLGRFTAELTGQFESACAHCGLALVSDCPPMDEPTYVDPEMWEKIVFNLLSNAFKYTFTGTIRVAVGKADGGTELVVQDTGIGIAADDIGHIFERFYRVKGARGRSIEGSGIGLALTHDLVALHGGSIDVASTPGAGSSFRVRIPLGTAHLPADRISAAPEVTPTAAGAKEYVAEILSWEGHQEEAAEAKTVPGGGEERAAPPVGGQRLRILVAEDNRDMRAYAVRLLEGAGYDVRAVGDGEAALAAAREEPPPDLILIDIVMPKLDGVALLRALRSSPKTEGVLAILVSVRAGADARIQGLDAGADDYIVKPFSSAELLARIAATIR